MSEHFTPDNSELAPQPYEQPAHIVNLSERLPEVAEKAEILSAVSKEMLDIFSIDPEMLDDPKRAFIFTAIADRWSRADTEAEWHFLHDALAMLAHKHSDVLGDAYAQGQSGTIHEKSPEEIFAIYDKYTNNELTKEFTEKQDEVFLGIRERIGVTADNEDLFEVRVMDIASDYTLGSLPYVYDYDSPGWEAESRRLRQWSKDLLSNRESFAAELGAADTPVLWVEQINGKKLLCLDVPTAKKLTDEKTFLDSLSHGDDVAEARRRLLSLAEHEYVHTQGGLLLDGESEFGIALEERRAEYFSGDKHGYYEIKRFLKDTAVVTGIDFLELFDSAPKGGAAEDIYAQIAGKIGLSSTLELLMTYPRNYIAEGQTNTIMKAAHEYLGGYDGLIQRTLDSEVGKSNVGQLREYVEDRARYSDTQGHDGIKMLNYVKEQGNNVITDMVLERLHDMRAKQPAGV